MDVNVPNALREAWKLIRRDVFAGLILSQSTAQNARDPVQYAVRLAEELVSALDGKAPARPATPVPPRPTGTREMNTVDLAPSRPPPTPMPGPGDERT